MTVRRSAAQLRDEGRCELAYLWRDSTRGYRRYLAIRPMLTDAEHVAEEAEQIETKRQIAALRAGLS